MGVLSCYPDVLRRKVKRVNIADTKSRDITFEGAFVCVCVWREVHVGNTAYPASHCRRIFELNQNASLILELTNVPHRILELAHEGNFNLIKICHDSFKCQTI